jgi:L-ascorbate 6-phosphate lactonase
MREMEMGNLANTIEADRVQERSLAIYWLSQAGFVFKTPSGKVVYIDPYFSDVVERMLGLKRMMPCPIAPEDVDADLVACTHEHLDHMDTDALPIIARNPRVHFAGPLECIKRFKELGISENRCHLLEEEKDIDLDGIRVKGVYADHGTFAPDALGIVFDLEGIKVYHTGDTAYRPEEFRPAIETRPDILIPCINGTYGNLNSTEAAQLTRDVRPRLAIASHFWMFVEHNGNPATFLQCCKRLVPEVQAIVMKPGERILFRKS